MPTSYRPLPLLLLTVTCMAGGSGFEFPDTITGFVGRPAMASFSEDGAITAALKKVDTTCDSVGIYEYRDGPAATAGLAQWLAQRQLTAREYDRTEQAVLWVATSEQMELIGEWMAPKPQQPGRLEMCHHRLVAEVRTSFPVALIGWLLAGVGALGSAAGGLYTRLMARRNS